MTIPAGVDSIPCYNCGQTMFRESDDPLEWECWNCGDLFDEELAQEKLEDLGFIEREDAYAGGHPERCDVCGGIDYCDCAGKEGHGG